MGRMASARKGFRLMYLCATSAENQAWFRRGYARRAEDGQGLQLSAIECDGQMLVSSGEALARTSDVSPGSACDGLVEGKNNGNGSHMTVPALRHI